MTSYLLTPLARADIFEIWSYIAADSEAAADRVEEAIFSACELVGKTPLIGHIRPIVTSRPVRFWTLTKFPNYAIVYRPGTEPVQIIAVLHGRRNLRRILGKRP